MKLLFEVLDFLFKAAAFFATTKEGQKEWADITAALAELENGEGGQAK